MCFAEFLLQKSFSLSFQRSEHRERSERISDSIRRERDAGTGLRVREALHH